MYNLGSPVKPGIQNFHHQNIRLKNVRKMTLICGGVLYSGTFYVNVEGV